MHMPTACLHARLHDPPQVTSDLAAFWAQGYAAVREDLLERFPGAAWPEDPTQAGPGREGGARCRDGAAPAQLLAVVACYLQAAELCVAPPPLSVQCATFSHKACGVCTRAFIHLCL